MSLSLGSRRCSLHRTHPTPGAAADLHVAGLFVTPGNITAEAHQHQYWRERCMRHTMVRPIIRLTHASDVVVMPWGVLKRAGARGVTRIHGSLPQSSRPSSAVPIWPYNVLEWAIAEADIELALIHAAPLALARRNSTGCNGNKTSPGEQTKPYKKEK